MATKAYVVSEGSFSYDDNYYSSEEGGHPNKVFLEEEQAQEYADQLGLNSFRELVEQDSIFEYGYGDIESVFNIDDEFDSFIKEKLGTTIDDWWDRRYSGPKRTLRYSETKDNSLKLSDEDWAKFYSYCNLQLVFITEVGFGDVFS